MSRTPTEMGVIEDFLIEVAAEVQRARALFPGNEGRLAAFSEEAGEVAKAMISEPMANVRTECVQAAAMALRLALEGDSTLEGVRAKYVRADAPEADKGESNG